MIGLDDLPEIDTALKILREAMDDIRIDVDMIQENLEEQTEPDAETESLIQNIEALIHKGTELLAFVKEINKARNLITKPKSKFSANPTEH